MTAPGAIFQPTPRQIEALRLFKKDRKDVSKNIIYTAYYGGSRSGKTRLICEMFHLLAMKYPGAWFFIGRKFASHAVLSIWLDTLKKVIAPDMNAIADINNQKTFIKYRNGSMIFVDGLDQADRVEKILGREYVGIFLNEASQIAYPTVEILQTRLAQRIPGLKPMLFLDFNPPAKTHWTYRLLIEGVNPRTKQPLPDSARYRVLRMNPQDNKDNIAVGYIENVLGQLGHDNKERFLYGNFATPEGVIFKKYEIIEAIPEAIKNYGAHSVGLDFGFTIDPAVVEDLYYYDNCIYIDELVYSVGLTNSMLATCMQTAGVAEYSTIKADSAEPKSITDLQEFFPAIAPCEKGPDSIRNGIDWLLNLKTIYITAKSVYTIDEFNNYQWKEDSAGEPLPIPEDKNNHAVDAIRYGAEAFHKPVIEPTVAVV